MRRARSISSLRRPEQEPGIALTSLADAAAAAFPRRELSASEARLLSYGGKLDPGGTGAAPVAAFGPDGSLVALLTDEGGRARSLAVFSQ